MAGVHAKEPKDLYLTENLSRHQLHPESSPIKRSDLLLIPDRKPHQVGPYFFFQILNHRRPEGYDSFVGEFIRALPLQGLVEFKYRHCSSGHGTYFLSTFDPRAFFYVTRVNRLQYGKLQKARIHKTFDRTDTHDIMSDEAVERYFSKCKFGDYVYCDDKTGAFYLAKIIGIDIDLLKRGSPDNTVDLLTGDLFNTTANPGQVGGDAREYSVNEFEYVKRLTRKEAQAAKREADDTEDVDDSGDSGSDGGFKNDEGGELSDSDRDPSEESFI